MVSFDAYVTNPIPLAEIVNAPWYFCTPGAELIEYEERPALSILVDDKAGRSVVVRLTAQQEVEARAIVSMTGSERHGATNAWLKSIQVGENEVLGTRANLLIGVLLEDGWEIQDAHGGES